MKAYYSIVRISIKCGTVPENVGGEFCLGLAEAGASGAVQSVDLFKILNKITYWLHAVTPFTF